MSTTKDPVRPTSQSNRLSMSSNGPNMLNRPSVTRPHSHSISLGALNASTRINRRKSSTSMTGVNRAALVAAIREGGGLPEGRPVSTSGLGLPNGYGTSGSAIVSDRNTSSVSRKYSNAALDTSSLKGSNKLRARRASEGSALKKERRQSNAGELKCETCGKGYKHGSCLQKHLWEHTPEWALTSKFLISKHAQVQMLEAASVLVTMTQEGQADNSDTSSQSPLPSATTSDPIEEDEEDEDDNSSRTSTPSQDDEYTAARPTAFRHPRARRDSYSSVFSRSYGSNPASSLPNDSGYGSSSRPTSGQAYADEQAEVAAAAEGLVGVSISTPQYRGSYHASSEHIPPVPPLPAKFAAQAAYSPSLRPQLTPDAEMSDEDHRQQRIKAMSEDEEEGMFGRMEQ